VVFCDKQNMMQENTEFNASLNKPDIYHPMIGIQEINTNNKYQFKKGAVYSVKIYRRPFKIVFLPITFFFIELKNDIILKGIFYEFL
jgi:hypothetical protein